MKATTITIKLAIAIKMANKYGLIKDKKTEVKIEKGWLTSEEIISKYPLAISASHDFNDGSGWVVNSIVLGTI